MIRVNDLRFAYPGHTQDTLNGLSFEVSAGEIFGFLGPSGSGKSTTQKLLIGLLRGYRGQAQLFGRDVHEWDARVYQRIGVGFELPNHYSKLSAQENLQLFASLYGLTGRDAKQRIDQLLEETGLTEAVQQRTDEFSKGMKMRLNFARALLPDPELLFLDEPTTGLDPVNAANIRQLIRRHQAQGKTIFLTTHNMHDADELCDRVAFIIDGQIKHVDSPHQMKRHYGQSTVALEQRNDQGELVTTEFPLTTLANNAEFQAQLAQWPVETIHSKEASLEDVFIQVTGERLV